MFAREVKVSKVVILLYERKPAANVLTTEH